MLYLVPSLKRICPYLHLKCVINIFCKIRIDYSLAKVSRKPEYSIDFHSLELILIIFCSFPHSRRCKKCIKKLSACINVINKIQYNSYTYKILHFFISIFCTWSSVILEYKLVDHRINSLYPVCYSVIKTCSF